MPGESANNGPTHGRFRNTMSELYNGVRRADPFPLGPSDSTALGMQRRDLFFQQRVAMAGLKSQAQQVKAQYRFAKQGIIGEGRAAMSDTEGALNDRGMIGSSVQMAEQEGVRSAAQGAIGEAFLNRQGALGAVNQSKLEAISQLRMGLSDIALQKAAQQRQMALAAFGSGGQNPWGF